MTYFSPLIALRSIATIILININEYKHRSRLIEYATTIDVHIYYSYNLKYVPHCGKQLLLIGKIKFRLKIL